LQTPEQMAKDLAEDIKSNADLINLANIKIE
jgi:hypothetical protein